MRFSPRGSTWPCRYRSGSVRRTGDAARWPRRACTLAALSRKVLIVGSGPAAAAAALACASRSDVHVTVLDIGARLEPSLDRARERLATAPPGQWRAEDLAAVGELPASSRVKGPPQKRAFGSDFPFRDVGQLEGIVGSGGANDALVSGAFGGFSNVWGAQVMPFPEATFRDWPVGLDEMRRHYGEVLKQIPFAAEEDDLAGSFPLLAPAAALPTLSERTAAVLSRYERHRAAVNRRRIIVGRARLAFDAARCVRCGLCMTGCPHQLIYSASQTIDHLQQGGALEYLAGLLAVRVEEDAKSATVVAKELESGRLRRFTADRVFLACGGVGTARLVAGSLDLGGRELRLQESSQFVLPFLSLAPTAHDPRASSEFTLNQFNMAVELDGGRGDVAHLHFYTYNQAFDDQLPSIFRTRLGAPLGAQVLRRVSVAFGYLPAWASPEPVLRIGDTEATDALPPIEVSGQRVAGFRNPTLRGVVRRIISAAPALDLWPILPMLRISALAKSYHWGSAFPHTRGQVGDGMRSDVLGRIGTWRRIHAIDGSTLPSVAATTFTLTVMANAHRIVEMSLKQLD